MSCCQLTSALLLTLTSALPYPEQAGDDIEALHVQVNTLLSTTRGKAAEVQREVDTVQRRQAQQVEVLQRMLQERQQQQYGQYGQYGQPPLYSLGGGGGCG